MRRKKIIIRTTEKTFTFIWEDGIIISPQYPSPITHLKGKPLKDAIDYLKHALRGIGKYRIKKIEVVDL